MVRRFAVLATMLLALALLFAAGVHNLRARRLAMQQAQQNHINLVKEGSPAADSVASPIPDGLGTDMRGKLAPAFTLASLAGKKVSLADYKGKPVIVNFWATYCGPCKLEMPWFEEFRQKYAAQGLTVLGIDDEDGVTNADVSKAAQHTGVTYPILLSDDKTSKAYGLGDYLPVTYYIAKNGVVTEQTPGAPSKDEIEANIRKTLAAGGE